jgi:serine/threonine-protein kinase HipA
MAICLGCLQDKKINKDYCKKCIKDIFDGVTPKALEFDKKEFYIQRNNLANRMSISGVQDKISLKFIDKKLVATIDDGKYILKPIPSYDYIKNSSDVVFNEHLSMKISQDIFKIDTAKCALIRFSDGEFAYIVKRFDYTFDDIKYDQEDFASILDVNSYKDGANYKYESKTYQDCAIAIKNIVPSYIVSLEDFFKRIVLNYLISNGDAHLKNFSLYSLPNNNDYMLTPNYDILNTRYHIDEVYGDMAMDLMEEYTDTYEAVGYYTYDDFYKFAKILNIKDIRFNKIISLANNSFDKVQNIVNRSFLSSKGKDYYIKSYQERLARLNYKL